ncbi:MAG: hypothetical protein KatS3mg105_1462 [Gemmatales bacterium]|nr:MAG: hypothetical protein KatS3mg105_1462 [Gemmatales bacterium]
MKQHRTKADERVDRQIAYLYVVRDRSPSLEPRRLSFECTRPAKWRRSKQRRR